MPRDRCYRCAGLIRRNMGGSVVIAPPKTTRLTRYQLCGSCIKDIEFELDPGSELCALLTALGVSDTKAALASLNELRIANANLERKKKQLQRLEEQLKRRPAKKKARG